MSNTNWRELFEEYRTGDLSEEKRAAMESAMENDVGLRAEYELFFAIQEGLDNERIRNKVSSIRKPKNNKGKNFTGFISIILTFIVAGTCFFAYRAIMDRPADTPEVEDIKIREASPARVPADSIAPQNNRTAPAQIEQEKERRGNPPPITAKEQPMAREASGIMSKELVSSYLSETTITKPLMRSGNQPSSPLAERVSSYLKTGEYAATINLLSMKSESEGIHPDDRLWFLSLAYLGDGNLGQAKKSLEEIAGDDFNTHHKMAAQLLAEIELLK